MAECECIKKCPFFNGEMNGMPHTINIYKLNYCKTDNKKCARYMVFTQLGKEAVPGDLYPHQTGDAQKIINQN